MPEAAGTINVLEILRIVGSLVIVAALIVVSGYVARKRMSRSTGRSLRVVERLSIARGAQLALVAHGDRRLLVGISDKGVQLVAELDDPAESESRADAPASPPRDNTVSFAERLAERLVSRLPSGGENA